MPSRYLSAAAALGAGLILGLFNLIAVVIEYPAGLIFYSYDFALFLGAGAISALLFIGAGYFQKARLGVLGIGIFALIYGFIIDDLMGFLGRHVPGHIALAQGAAALGLTAGLLLLGEGGVRIVNCLWRRGIAAGIGIIVVIANGIVLPLDYPGAHLFLSLVSGIFIGLAVRIRLSRRVVLFGTSLGLVAGVATVIIPPSNMVRVALLKVETSSIAPFMMQLWAASEAEDVQTTDAWFIKQRSDQTIPPSGKPFISDAMVLFITIDALRADVLIKHRDRFPTLARLAEEGTWFEAARTPGAQTVYTLSSVFIGTYFSQQRWARAPKTPETLKTRAAGHLWPYLDQTPRFPELLTKAGVRTINIAASSWLVNSVGVVRGFSEEQFVRDRIKYTHAARLTDVIIKKLTTHGPGQLFFYTHYLDPHLPYDRAGKQGTPFERYLREIELVDRALGRLWSALISSGHGERLYWIITGDHGEAFGDHGAISHGTTLYEEQLKVPLIFYGPDIPVQRIEEPVSLIDLAPTFLDLFRQPTPGHMMGQSLAPFLDGERPTLSRPLFAEGRLKKALLIDSFKVIVDDRRHTVEVYDLSADPGETHNISESSTGTKLVQKVRQFFKTHQLKDYEVPYRP